MEINEGKVIPNGSLKTNHNRISSPDRIPPESPGGSTNPTEFKKMENSLSVTKNRVALLRMQLQKEKDTIKKNKSLTKDVIAKKVAFNEVNMYKQKDNT